jgi:hypothetical protein
MEQFMAARGMETGGQDRTKLADNDGTNLGAREKRKEAKTGRHIGHGAVYPGNILEYRHESTRALGQRNAIIKWDMWTEHYFVFRIKSH